VYLASTEYISAKKSKGEVLLFRRGRVPDLGPKPDEESNVDDRLNAELVLSREKTVPDAPPSIHKQTAVFHWSSVTFDIKIKSEPRRLLDDIDGWVKPGTLTALMVYFPTLSSTFRTLTHKCRVFREPERPHFWTCLLAVLLWA
jgi:ATP-binding cassette, subfamily G (WHITE), member 2, PDR